MAIKIAIPYYISIIIDMLRNIMSMAQYRAMAIFYAILKPYLRILFINAV